VVPIVNGLMKQYTDRVAFVRVNIRHPQSAELQAQLGFSATPEFYLIDPQGRVERKWDETVDVAELEKTIQALPVKP
jgi:hypothetical protein